MARPLRVRRRRRTCAREVVPSLGYLQEEEVPRQGRAPVPIAAWQNNRRALTARLRRFLGFMAEELPSPGKADKDRTQNSHGFPASALPPSPPVEPASPALTPSGAATPEKPSGSSGLSAASATGGALGTSGNHQVEYGHPSDVSSPNAGDHGEAARSVTSPVGDDVPGEPTHEEPEGVTIIVKLEGVVTGATTAIETIRNSALLHGEPTHAHLEGEPEEEDRSPGEVFREEDTAYGTLDYSEEADRSVSSEEFVDAQENLDDMAAAAVVSGGEMTPATDSAMPASATIRKTARASGKRGRKQSRARSRSSDSSVTRGRKVTTAPRSRRTKSGRSSSSSSARRSIRTAAKGRASVRGTTGTARSRKSARARSRSSSRTSSPSNARPRKRRSRTAVGAKKRGGSRVKLNIARARRKRNTSTSSSSRASRRARTRARKRTTSRSRSSSAQSSSSGARSGGALRGKRVPRRTKAPATRTVSSRRRARKNEAHEDSVNAEVPSAVPGHSRAGEAVTTEAVPASPRRRNVARSGRTRSSSSSTPSNVRQRKRIAARKKRSRSRSLSSSRRSSSSGRSKRGRSTAAKRRPRKTASSTVRRPRKVLLSQGLVQEPLTLLPTKRPRTRAKQQVTRGTTVPTRSSSSRSLRRTRTAPKGRKRAPRMSSSSASSSSSGGRTRKAGRTPGARKRAAPKDETDTAESTKVKATRAVVSVEGVAKASKSMRTPRKAAATPRRAAVTSRGPDKSQRQLEENGSANADAIASGADYLSPGEPEPDIASEEEPAPKKRKGQGM